MSYILDALDRAERDRHGAGVPTLATVHSPAPPARSRWPWVWGGVLLVNIMVIVLLLFRGGPVAGPTNTADSPFAPTAAALSTGSRKSLEPQEATGSNLATEARSTPVAPAPVVPAPVALAPAAPAPAVLVRPSLALEEKAPQSGLAALKLEMLVNAVDPAERAVYIGGRRYVSGQTLESGAMIESIAQDTVVLRWAGQRYRLGLGSAPTPIGR